MMARCGDLTVSVSVEKSIHEMFDVCEELRVIESLIPSWNSDEFQKSKEHIIEIMTNWIEDYGKDHAKV